MSHRTIWKNILSHKIPTPILQFFSELMYKAITPCVLSSILEINRIYSRFRKNSSSHILSYKIFITSNYCIIISLFRCCKMHDYCYEVANCPKFLEYFVPYLWKCYKGRPLCGKYFL